jgi:predicted RecB family nuclease
MTMPLAPDVSLPLLQPAYRLSKSRFLAGLQCDKRLFLDIHHPELASKPDAATQAILAMGSEVGEQARKRFPGGILVEAGYRQAREALARTAALLADPNVPAIFEGAFQFDHVLVRVDILARVGTREDGIVEWRLIEVKSSTRVKDVHLEDLAIQSYVVRGTGISLAGTGVLHVNTQYVYAGGDIDLEQLFTLRDLTDEVNARGVVVPQRLSGMQTMLMHASPPDRKPGRHCHTPYECPYWSHCTKDKGARWIFYLPGSGKTATLLADKGIDLIDDIPAGVNLSLVQQRVKDNVEWIGDDLALALSEPRYPVHHLDFETFMPAIPKFSGTRPYQVLPTQWSNHIEHDDGTVTHSEFLCRHARDPREEFVVTLLESLGQQGSICVYSSYERAILERLADSFPSLSLELKAVIGRLWDLYHVVKEHYYHPAFEGSYSIKSVLPAVVPSLGYHDLAVQEGGSAAYEYYRMVFEETDWVEKERIAESLSHYCARDTQAMLELRRALKAKVPMNAADL